MGEQQRVDDDEHQHDGGLRRIDHDLAGVFVEKRPAKIAAHQFEVSSPDRQTRTPASPLSPRQAT